MSHYLERLVRDNSTLKGSPKTVLIALAGYARDDGKGAHPSVATLAKNIGRKERTVRSALKGAVEAGELKRIFNYGPNGTNCYEIRIERLHESKNCTPAKSAYKGSSLKRNYSYSSLRSSSLRSPSQSESVPKTESVATPKPKIWRLWAKRGDSDWQCPICLKVGCPGCPVYITDDALNASFDEAMRGTLDAGKPGPAQVASERLLKKANDEFRPSFFRFLLTPDRKARIDSLSNKIVPLPRLPHGHFCQCAHCESATNQPRSNPSSADETAAERVPTHSGRISSGLP
jgi:hypothetical protein